MCVVVRYLDKETGRIRDNIFELVLIFDSDEEGKADAITIVDKLTSTFEEVEIPLENVIAFCSDTCNLMMGIHNSVSEKLGKIIPGIKIIKCANHLQHLCARDAIKLMPPVFEQVVHQVYNYFSVSSNRCARWEILQCRSKLGVLKVLKPVTTRWLSYFLCILRIYRRWTALMIFFEGECKDVTGKTDQVAKNLLQYFEDPLNKLYHLFLVTIYFKLYEVNKEMQSEKPLVQADNDIVRKLYLYFLKLYMRSEYLKKTDLANINPKNASEWVELHRIILNDDVREKMLEVTNTNDKRIFLQYCQNFLVELCSKLKQRYNFDDDLSVHIICLHPQNALNKDFHENKYKDLDELLKTLPKLTNFHDVTLMRQINEEWSGLISYAFKNNITEEENIDTFWVKIGECVDEKGHHKFKNLSDFALNVLLIPMSNASSERVWSDYNRKKTKNGANLGFGTTRALLQASQHIRNVGGLIFFEPTYEMFVHMIWNLDDKIDNGRFIENTGMYKGIQLNEEYLRQCRMDETFNKKLNKKRKLKECDMFKLMKDGCDAKKKGKTDSINNEFEIEKENGWIVDESDDVDDKLSKQIPEEIEETFEKKLNQDMKLNESDMLSLIQDDRDVEDRETIELSDDELKIKENILIEDEYDLVDDQFLEDISEEIEEFHGESIMRNGLFPNHDYYFTELSYMDEHGMIKENIYTIGKYSTRNNWQQPLLLDSTEYHTLAPKAWIDGVVIDACATIHAKNWKNSNIAISTMITFTFFQDDWKENPDDSWLMFHVEFPRNGKILMPYLHKNHWRLFMINSEEGIITLIDPYRKSMKELESEGLRVLGHFNRFLNICKQKNIKNIITEVSKWELKWFVSDRPHKGRNDG